MGPAATAILDDHEASGSVSNTIEKTMTLSAGEFARSMVAFAGEDVVIKDGRARIPVAGAGGDGDAAASSQAPGVAEIEFHALPPRRIGGGLLELPQARVTITLEGVDAAGAQAFLSRFDIAFQRGGG